MSTATAPPRVHLQREAGPRFSLASAASAAVVVLAAVVSWLVSGVGFGHILLFLGYELVFILAPGWLVWRALSGPEPGSPLRQLVFAWALGNAVEIAAFVITGFLGIRGALPAYPLVVAAICARPAWARRRAPVAPPVVTGSRWWSAAVAALCVVALGYLATGLFTQKPLPGHFSPSVAYDADTVYAISLTDEARDHWPIHNPTVSDTPLPYHVFAFMKNASLNQVTGIPPVEIVTRFAPTALFILTLLGVALVGRELSPRRPWAGPLAAAIVFFVGELDPFRTHTYLFGNSMFLDLYLSPTFLLGLTFFVPSLLVLSELFAERPPPRAWARWAVLALLICGCAGSKATILPVLGVGIAAVAIWGLIWHRSVAVRAIAAGLGVVAIFGLFYVVQYSGRSGGFTVAAFAVLRESDAGKWLDAHGGLPAVAILGTLGFAGAMFVGIPAAFSRRERPAPAPALLLGTLLGGLLPLWVLDSVDGSHLYFVWYGVVAGAILSAIGLMRLLPLGHIRFGRVLGAGIAVVLAVGVLDQVLDLFPTILDRARAHEALYGADDQGAKGITPEMLTGLEWARDHTHASDVLAVNNHFRDAAGGDSRYFYYSAFSQRRVFLESWLYTARTASIGYEKVVGGVQPFPLRARLNAAVFDRADPSAMAALRRDYGVTMLVVDRRHGPPAPRLERRAPRLFANRDIAIYANRPG
jgi:hypothetical protein